MVTIKESLAAGQHGVIQVASREMEKLLKIARGKKTAPHTVLGVFNQFEHGVLYLIFNLGQGIAASAEREVFEEDAETIKRLLKLQLPHCSAFTIDLQETRLIGYVVVEHFYRSFFKCIQRINTENESECGIRVGSARCVLPDNLILEHQIQFPATASITEVFRPLNFGFGGFLRPGRRDNECTDE